MTTILLGILVALFTLIALVIRLRFDQQRQHEDQLTAQLITAIPPNLATSDPRVILGWAHSFKIIRHLFPKEIQRVEDISGQSFPVSNAIVEQVHARWTAEWLAWELKHDADYREKAALLQSDVTVTDQETASKLRARSSRLEDEKLQSYQQRYEEYVSVGKALTDLQKTDR